MTTRTTAEMLLQGQTLSSAIVVASPCTPAYRFAEERPTQVQGNLDHIQKPGFRW